MAERLSLPVPTARCFDPTALEPAQLGLRFPLIIKPVTRLDRWNDLRIAQSAVRRKHRDSGAWPQSRATGLELLAQEFIPGTEARIESYHCYVDKLERRFAGEFTGRKPCMDPSSYGHTTALEITDVSDVRRVGRDIVERLSLTGVAKLDFKRDPQGNLRLLEINPRFNLWHHSGRRLPASTFRLLVDADLTGSPRPPATRLKAGVRWCRPWKDSPAARAAGDAADDVGVMNAWLRSEVDLVVR